MSFSNQERKAIEDLVKDLVQKELESVRPVIEGQIRGAFSTLNVVVRESSREIKEQIKETTTDNKDLLQRVSGLEASLETERKYREANKKETLLGIFSKLIDHSKGWKLVAIVLIICITIVFMKYDLLGLR